MREFKINNKGSKELFTNRILERLTRTNFAVPVVFYFLLSGCILYFTSQNYSISLFTCIMLFFSGAILFTLVEYLIHRFIFHFNAVTDEEQRLQYNIHGVHHEYPRDKSRLVMPPVISIVLSALFYFLFLLLLGAEGNILFAGFIAGYSIYLLIHYAVHTLKPPDNFFRYLWKHHSLHHYSSVDTAFSVSFPLWDRLFGTMPTQNKTHANRLPDEKK